MDLSGHIILEYLVKNNSEFQNAAAGFDFHAGIDSLDSIPDVESLLDENGDPTQELLDLLANLRDATLGYTDTDADHIRIHYLNDEGFLYNDANGFFLSGEPTANMTDRITSLEAINISNWGHIRADESWLDAKDVRSGFTRVFNTYYDKSGETNSEARCGIGFEDDLNMIRIMNFDPNDVIGPGQFTISGDILTGLIREQSIDHGNIYNYAPELQDGYLYLDGQETYLYGSKVTEVFPDHISGSVLSGTPNDYAPIMIRVGTIDPLTAGCQSGLVSGHLIFESDQFHDHHSEEWNDNVTPLSPFHKAEGLSRVYISGTEIEDRELSGNPIATNYYDHSGTVQTITSGSLVVTYEELGEDKCILPDTDLSPLTWEDGDRIFAIQSQEKDPYSIAGYLTQSVIQPVVSTEVVSGDTNLIHVVANIRDEDGAPLSGVIVRFDIEKYLENLSGDIISSTQSLDEYEVLSYPSGNRVRSIEHKAILDESYSGDIFDSYQIGLFRAIEAVQTYAMPARAYFDVSGDIGLVKYAETDIFGSAELPIRIHNFNNYTTDNAIRLSISGTPTISDILNFRILSVGTSIDGYVDTPVDGFSIPNIATKFQYVDFSGATPEIELNTYPYGGEQMVRLYTATDFSDAHHVPGLTSFSEPLVTDRGSELWYDGEGHAHVTFNAALSGGYVGWEMLISHTADLIGVNYD